MSVTHRVVPRTVRWPAPRCPACCDGGGWASWSCSTAWTGTAGSAPSRRTPPGPQEATVRRTRPGETRRKPRRACRCRPAWTLQTRRAKVWRSLTETRIRTPTQFFPLCWLRLCGCYIPGLQLEDGGEGGWFFLFTFTQLPSSTCFLSSPLWLSPSLSLSLSLFFPLSSSLIPHDKSVIPFRWKTNILKPVYHPLAPITAFLQVYGLCIRQIHFITVWFSVLDTQ